MTTGLSLDLARAALLLSAAYDDEAAGHDPVPNFLRSRAVIAPGDLAEACGCSSTRSCELPEATRVYSLRRCGSMAISRPTPTLSPVPSNERTARQSRS